MKHSILQSDGRLQEIPEMNKPFEPLFPRWESPEYLAQMEIYKSETDKYNAALSFCKSYEIVGTHNWKSGDRLQQGKDYEILPDNPEDGYSKYVAVPVKPVSSILEHTEPATEEQQEQLWREAAMVLFKRHNRTLTEKDLMGAILLGGFKKDMIALSQEFIITRKII